MKDLYTDLHKDQDGLIPRQACSVKCRVYTYSVFTKVTDRHICNSSGMRPQLLPMIASSHFVPQNRRAQFTSSTPFTPKYVYSTLGVSGKASAAFTYNERIRHQFILLENPEKKSRIALLNAAQAEKIKKAKERRRLGVIGRNEAIEKGMWKLKKEQARCVSDCCSGWIMAIILAVGGTCSYPCTVCG